MYIYGHKELANMSAWMVRKKLLIQINRRNPGFPSTFSEKKTLRDHPPKAGKYVQRLSVKREFISYMFTTKVQRRNSRRTTWQYKSGWCDFVLQAVKLTEVISRAIVLMILRSVCIFSFN